MSTRLPTASSAVVSSSREARVSEGAGTERACLTSFLLGRFLLCLFFLGGGGVFLSILEDFQVVNFAN